MDTPRCFEHGRTVLDLALGRLDDDAAVRAEEILRACDVCSGWWQTHFEGDAGVVVDEAVSEAWATFSPPRQRRLRPWLAAAAAAVFALTVYWAQLPDRGSSQPPAEIVEAAPEGESHLAADRGQGEWARNSTPRWTAVPRDLPAPAGLAPGGPRAEAVETDQILGAVFGGDDSAADAGSLARILGSPRSASS